MISNLFKPKPSIQQSDIHFLHLGKCAGSALKVVIDSVNRDAQAGARLVAHPHTTKLSDLPQGARYFFSIRNPITRFYSSFYSRKRKGQPRLYVEWSEGEQKAFARFPHANDLAESLFLESDAGIAAFSAMHTISHIKQPQHSWFPSVEEVLVTRPPLCILRQEKLEEDYLFLKKVIPIRDGITLEKDAVKRHQNDYSATPVLSEKAIENLTRWYAADIQFYALATAWIEANQTS